MNNALSIKKHDKLLIVAPHPDDETIGCGGILAAYGPQCSVLLLTDGCLGKSAEEQSEEETAAVRKQEFETVMAFFGVNQYWMLDIKDGRLGSCGKEIPHADLSAYDFIFVPNRNERHPDHKAAFDVFRKMCRRQHIESRLIEYEVWSPIISANFFFDMSDLIDKKIGALQHYASQIRAIDYEALVKGLNSYRGAPQHVRYCEAYYSEEKDRKNRRQRWAASLPKWLLRLIRMAKRVGRSDC